MPTYNQLCNKKRIKKKKKKKTPALDSSPQKKGICTKLVLRTPKKPNSALRKLARLKLSNKKKSLRLYSWRRRTYFARILKCSY